MNLRRLKGRLAGSRRKPERPCPGLSALTTPQPYALLGAEVDHWGQQIQPHPYWQPCLFSTSSPPLASDLIPSRWGEYLVCLTAHPGTPSICLHMPPAAPNHSRKPYRVPSLLTTESQNLSRTACSHHPSPHSQGIINYATSIVQF